MATDWSGGPAVAALTAPMDNIRLLAPDRPMAGEHTIIVGIDIPSASPVFLAGVATHVVLALICALAGAGAIFSRKAAGRHPRLGSVYYFGLVAVVVTAAGLAAVRWAEDFPLFILAAFSVAMATMGREARRRQWPGWVRLHIVGMGGSYILLLTAFYVDNGKSLPLWKALPPIAHWIVPGAVGVPLVVLALLRHPLAGRPAT